MSVMRIAVAGTGGLARLIALHILRETTHQVVFLSRHRQRTLIREQYSLAVVDYSDIDSVEYALRGADTVISTVTGLQQIELIKAAIKARVRRFVPAEFEGPPQSHPALDPLDRSRTLARQLLVQNRSRIESTIFVCGILYERFGPGGLAESDIGITSGLDGEGDYIMDCRNMTAETPAYSAGGQREIAICMTAAEDLARFVCRAVDLHDWPPELRMRGERVLVRDLISQVEVLRGQRFEIKWHEPGTLRAELQAAAAQGNVKRQVRLQALLKTAQGMYDFAQPNLNEVFSDIQPQNFATWFSTQWAGQ